jgi:hypothetical protein
MYSLRSAVLFNYTNILNIKLLFWAFRRFSSSLLFLLVSLNAEKAFRRRALRAAWQLAAIPNAGKF